MKEVHKKLKGTRWLYHSCTRLDILLCKKVTIWRYATVHMPGWIGSYAGQKSLHALLLLNQTITSVIQQYKEGDHPSFISIGSTKCATKVTNKVL